MISSKKFIWETVSWKRGDHVLESKGGARVKSLK